jgi:hypothetical protein
MTYSGALWRILRTRRRLRKRGLRVGLTPILIITLVFWWVVVSAWYPIYILGRVFLWAVRWERWKSRRRRRIAERRAQRSAHKPGA